MSKGHDWQRRRKAFREPKKTMLIVCEGEKTEPNYLNALLKELRIASVVVVEGSPDIGTAPLSLVKHAKSRNQGKVGSRNSQFDQVWIVGDVDEHPLPHALDKAKGNCFNYALSNPCFELWFLLHFTYSTAQHHRHALQALLKKQHLPGYDKAGDYYGQLKSHTEHAKANAEKLQNHHQQAGSAAHANPSTNVHELVTALQKLAKK